MPGQGGYGKEIRPTGKGGEPVRLTIKAPPKTGNGNPHGGKSSQKGK